MRKRGVTLVELMVGVILSSLVLGIGYNIWTYVRRDFSTANMRQQLQSEVRRTLDIMAVDFKSMKAGSLKVSDDETKIELERFALGPSGDKLSSEHVEKVCYTFKKPVLTRNQDGKADRVLGKNIQNITFTRGASAENITIAITDVPEPDRERALNARIDILVEAAAVAPVTGKIASHSEKISVFMRDEYYSTLSEGKGITLASLVKYSDPDAITSEDAADFAAMLTGGVALDPEALAKLPDNQLAAVETTEQEALDRANERLEELKNTLNDLDTRGEKVWGLGWLGIRHNTELTGIRSDIIDADKGLDKPPFDADKYKAATEKLDGSIEKLNTEIDKYENSVLTTAFDGSGVDIIALKNSETEEGQQQYKVYQEACELKLSDWKMKTAHEEAQKDLPEDERTEYVSTILVDPASLQKGLNAAGEEFTENDEDFQQRKTYADSIWKASTNIDIDKVHEEKEDDLRLYSTAKEMKDLAEAKKVCIEAKGLHTENLEKIDTEQSKRTG